MRALTLTVSTLAVFAAAPGLAQTTSAEILSEWQAAFLEADLSLSIGAQDQDGDALILRMVTTSLPIDEGKMRVTVPEMVLTDQGTGEVQIELNGDVIVLVDADEATVAGRVRHEGLDWTAAGTPDARSYRYNAELLEFVADEALTPDGTDVPLDLSFAAENFTSDYLASGGRLTTTYAAAAIQFDIAAEDEEFGQPTSFSMSYRMRDLEGDSDTSSAALLQGADPSYFATEEAASGTVVHQGTGYTIEVNSPDGDMIVDGSSAGGALGAAFGPDGLAYDIAGQGIKWRFAGDQLPFPVEVSLDAMGIDLSTPLLESPDPQPFGLRVALGGLTGSDGLWNLFDPSEVLPRDPGELILDISGSQIVLQSLLELDENTFQAPVELTALDINGILLSLVGAELTGQGNFTFPENAPAMVPGMPGAVGALDLKLLGANALIDRLVQIGILQPQDVMGIRMMMGMAARPGDEPDSLVSSIKLTPDGGLIANGMQLR